MAACEQYLDTSRSYSSSGPVSVSAVDVFLGCSNRLSLDNTRDTFPRGFTGEPSESLDRISTVFGGLISTLLLNRGTFGLKMLGDISLAFSSLSVTTDATGLLDRSGSFFAMNAFRLVCFLGSLLDDEPAGAFRDIFEETCGGRERYHLRKVI
uniref:(northern house mosquito) hypothetical protein n=1 Tax=Culex pipiens TaxID=7175 RepID=A0A8D8IEK4_CULPI